MLDQLRELAEKIEAFIGGRTGVVEAEVRKAGEHIRAAIAEIESLLASPHSEGADDLVGGDGTNVVEPPPDYEEVPVIPDQEPTSDDDPDGPIADPAPTSEDATEKLGDTNA